MGRAAPEWSNRKRDLLVCTAGITPDLEWRRLYPIVIDDLEKLHGFCWVDIRDTADGTGDPRPESRKVVRGHADTLTEISKVEDHAIRKWYVQQLVKDCSEVMKVNHETVGIVKPVVTEVILNEVDPKPNPLNEGQPSLSAWMDFFDRQRAQEAAKVAYATKEFELRFKFNCGSKCKLENGHNMKVLDLEAFMLYRHVSQKYSDSETIFQKMKEKIDQEFERNDVYFALGTHRLYPFHSYMIGTMIRIKKGIKAVEPLVVGE